MKLEQQVCSLELAQKLKELGVKQGSYVNWVKHPVTASWVLWTATDILNDYEGKVIGRGDVQRCSAFTVAELGEMLPSSTRSYKVIDSPEWYCNYRLKEDEQAADTEADARAKMLIYLLENKLLANK